MMAEGFRDSELFSHGRLAQSIAFLSAPGRPLLYSGVTNSRASFELIASLSARFRREVSVVVAGIEREILNGDLNALQV